jgi:anti-sigma regulatory factor (Ser/Thr protein kinase)
MSATTEDRRLVAQLRSDIGEVASACAQVRELLKKNHLPDRIFHVELVVRECLNNAMLHGNAQDPAKKTTLKVTVGRKWICVRVADQGPGFDWQNQAPPDFSNAHCNGRGLGIIKLYSRRVAHNAKGNEIAVWMNKDKPTITSHE